MVSSRQEELRATNYSKKPQNTLSQLFHQYDDQNKRAPGQTYSNNLINFLRLPQSKSVERNPERSNSQENQPVNRSMAGGFPRRTKQVKIESDEYYHIPKKMINSRRGRLYNQNSIQRRGGKPFRRSQRAPQQSSFKENRYGSLERLPTNSKAIFKPKRGHYKKKNTQVAQLRKAQWSQNQRFQPHEENRSALKQALDQIKTTDFSLSQRANMLTRSYMSQVQVDPFASQQSYYY